MSENIIVVQLSFRQHDAEVRARLATKQRIAPSSLFLWQVQRMLLPFSLECTVFIAVTINSYAHFPPKLIPLTPPLMTPA
jgi:hypothetical protein